MSASASPADTRAGRDVRPFALAVFCGSSTGRDPAHADAAREVGAEIARRGWTLVYGGGRVGLMGIIADAALAGGARIVGVIPKFLYTREVAHDRLAALDVVDTLAQRKQRMGELADAYMSMPGGVGTMDELFEAWSWSQVGLQSKPNGLLNVGGYYDALIDWLDGAVAQGFVRPQHRELLSVATDVRSLLDTLHRLAGP